MKEMHIIVRGIELRKIFKDDTDNYGEVLVDHLEPGAEYEITIAAACYKPFLTVAKLDVSRNIGLVLLEKR